MFPTKSAFIESILPVFAIAPPVAKSLSAVDEYELLVNFPSIEPMCPSFLMAPPHSGPLGLTPITSPGSNGTNEVESPSEVEWLPVKFPFIFVISPAL